MYNYNIDSRYLVNINSTSKGAQKKYLKDNYWYKVDKLGKEGFVEFLVSKLLECSTLSVDYYVHYELCMINGKYGCRSKNFLQSREQTLTYNQMYEMSTGDRNLADYLAYLGNEKMRLMYLLTLSREFGVSAKEYFNIILYLDFLIYNTDRHPSNISIITMYNKGCKPGVIFDNGCGLNTDRKNIQTSATISGSFASQIIACGYPLQSPFKIDYDKVMSILNQLDMLYGKSWEVEFLRQRLIAEQELFRL